MGHRDLDEALLHPRSTGIVFSGQHAKKEGRDPVNTVLILAEILFCCYLCSFESFWMS